MSLVDPNVEDGISNYPNPFRAGTENTNISYWLDSDADVTVKIYNLFGDLVRSFEFNSGQAGGRGGQITVVPWDGTNLKADVVGNGGYICVVEPAGGGKLVRKIAVVK